MARAHKPTPYSAPTDQPWLAKFGGGVLAAAVAFTYGLIVVCSQSATIYYRNDEVHLIGINAVLYGLAWLSAGVLVHIHCFWRAVFDEYWWATLVTIISLCIAIVSLIALIIRAGILGLR